MTQLADRIHQIEQHRAGKFQKQKKLFQKERVAYVEIESSGEEGSDIDNDVCLVELQNGPPNTCQALRQAHTKEKMGYINKKKGKTNI